MIRIGHSPRLHIEHPRQGSGKESRVTLWVLMEGKREDTVQIAMCERDLIELAAESLNMALILSDINEREKVALAARKGVE